MVMEPRICPCCFGRNAFFDLDRRVKSGRPAAVKRHAAAKFVHHLHNAIFDHVIHIAAQQSVGVQRILQSRVDRQVAFIKKIAATQAPARPSGCPKSVSIAFFPPGSEL